METTNHDRRESVDVADGVTLTRLAVGDRMSVQRFSIDPGASLPEHSHPHEQVGHLLEGTLVFEVDGEEIVVEATDTYVIPGGEPHGAHNPGDRPAVGLDAFSPPRDDPDWQDD